MDIGGVNPDSGAAVTIGELRTGAGPAVQPRSLRSGVGWLGVATAVYLACQYGMLIAIAKLGSATMVGQFALAQAITAPIMIFSQMQLRQVQVTDVRRDATFHDYLWTRGLTTLAALVVIAVYALGIADATVMGPIILMVGIAKAAESLSDVAYGRLQQDERMELIAFAMIAKGLSSLAVLALVLWLTGDLRWAVAALALVWLVLLGGVDLPLQRRVPTPRGAAAPDRRRILGLLRTALPLAVAAGLISLSANLPRYFLDGLYGSEAVALFAVAAMPLVLLGLVGTALGQATLPRAAALLQSGNLAGFRRIAVRITALQIGAGAAAAIASALFGAPLIGFFFTPEYVPAAPAMTAMAAGVAIGGLGAYGATVLSAGRHFRLQLWNVVIMLAMQVGLCYFLIGRLGVMGAAWAEVVRYVGSTAFLTLAAHFVIRSRYRAAPRRA
ncbi:MAG TPA: oligosaccharide flippase family protein [Longimicrobiales bacterium]|nr:oligosaccharide flippase family protein [Longimicrobiales bacterium]